MMYYRWLIIFLLGLAGLFGYILVSDVTWWLVPPTAALAGVWGWYCGKRIVEG